jgi:phospholipase/carboxylesterase
VNPHLKSYRVPPLSGTTDTVVIFLHGLGDSGSGGLLEIGRMWKRALPNTEFLCPDAPFTFDMAPPNFNGYQWFSLREFTPQSVTTGVRHAAKILDDYIDEVLAERNLPMTKLALVGFSQGTMMALHVALRRKEPIAALLGYSGMLADPESLMREKKSAPPILLVHGMEDDVVPFSALGETERALKTAGLTVKTLACPRLAHSIDETGLVAGMNFLQQHLK